MAYDSNLAERVTDALVTRCISFQKKAMMGGLCFMVDDKMCLGVSDDRLMVRLDPAVEADALQRPGCHPMDLTGRPMRGFVFVHAEGHRSDAQLRHWIELALAFNPKAKSSKRRSTRSS